MTELMPSLCNDCVARNQCGKDDVKMCISYTKEIKIKCDDCKFVEDCVDYGWEGCKKFTQKQPHTNEEQIKQCNTEQLAEELLAWWFDGANTYSQFGLFKWEIDEAKDKITKWLKEKHNG